MRKKISLSLDRQLASESGKLGPCRHAPPAPPETPPERVPQRRPRLAMQNLAPASPILNLRLRRLLRATNIPYKRKAHRRWIWPGSGAAVPDRIVIYQTPPREAGRPASKQQQAARRRAAIRARSHARMLWPAAGQPALSCRQSSASQLHIMTASEDQSRSRVATVTARRHSPTNFHSNSARSTVGSESPDDPQRRGRSRERH